MDILGCRARRERKVWAEAWQIMSRYRWAWSTYMAFRHRMAGKVSERERERVFTARYQHAQIYDAWMHPRAARGDVRQGAAIAYRCDAAKRMGAPIGGTGKSV